MTAILYREEMKRKLIHLSSLWIPLLYCVAPRDAMLAALSAITALLLMMELARRVDGPVKTWFDRHFGQMLRAHEQQTFRLIGATYTLLGAVLAVWLFPKPIAIAALLVEVVSDTAAALVGRRWGKHALHTKSVEGTAAFAVSALLCVLPVYYAWPDGPPLTAYMAGICAATVVELYTGLLKLDDNITIPLAFGIGTMGVSLTAS